MDLVLLPGFLADAGAFERLVPLLPADVKCSVAEYGASDTISAMAAGALRGAPEKFAVAGHSMGGRVALEIWRQAPKRVLGLALLDSAYQARPFGPDGEKEASNRAAMLEAARSQGMRAMGRAWISGLLHPQRVSDPEFMEAVLVMIERQPIERVKAHVRALLARPDAGPLLPNIDCPALVLCGRDDPSGPLENRVRIAALIPGARLQVIDRCGHMSVLEQPEEVARAMTAWLASIR